MSGHDKLREAIKWGKRVTDMSPSGWDALRDLIAAAESTLPKTTMVEVWRVEYAYRHHVTGDWLAGQHTWPTQDGVEHHADKLREDGAACIRVTGPHMQEVPA